MKKREKAIKNILIQTTAFIMQYGAQQLTMRKIAQECQISLSNLQYYFKNKEQLLESVIANYFKACEKEILSKIPIKELSSLDIESSIRKILSSFLFSDQANPQLQFIKELWALSNNSPAIKKIVNKYYSNYIERLIEITAAHTEHPEKIVSIIVPYIEGYTIMGDTLPLNKEEIINMLVQLITLQISSNQ